MTPPMGLLAIFHHLVKQQRTRDYMYARLLVAAFLPTVEAIQRALLLALTSFETYEFGYLVFLTNELFVFGHFLHALIRSATFKST